MGELEPRISFRAPLRCDGIGRLDCAEDTVSGVRLAVRWLPLEANGGAAVRACEALPRHPTLPRIRQTGQVGDAAFVAMDFPEGRLLSAVQGERVDVDLLLRMAAQLADALATVHQQGVLHGELCADSVLWVPPDRAWLWDMPLVIANRLTDRRGESRLMQNLVRSAAFLAPERVRGGPALPEGDVYSLGVVLCVAAGAPLPIASSTLGVLNLVATGRWTPRVPRLFPAVWGDVLQRMVGAEPDRRPTAREVADAFARALQGGAAPTLPEFPAVQPPGAASAASAASAATGTRTLPVVTQRASAVESSASSPARRREPPVALTDSIIVAADLVRAGARRIDAGAPRAAAQRLGVRPRRSRRVWLVGAAGAAAALVMGGLLVELVLREPPEGAAGVLGAGATPRSEASRPVIPVPAPAPVPLPGSPAAPATDELRGDPAPDVVARELEAPHTVQRGQERAAAPLEAQVGAAPAADLPAGSPASPSPLEPPPGPKPALAPESARAASGLALPRIREAALLRTAPRTSDAAPSGVAHELPGSEGAFESNGPLRASPRRGDDGAPFADPDLAAERADEHPVERLKRPRL